MPAHTPAFPEGCSQCQDAGLEEEWGPGWKTQQWPQDWKRSVFIPIPKKGNAGACPPAPPHCACTVHTHGPYRIKVRGG